MITFPIDDWEPDWIGVVKGQTRAVLAIVSGFKKGMVFVLSAGSEEENGNNAPLWHA